MATTWTATTFKARYTTFAATADSVVTAALAEADRRTSPRWGDRREDAIALLAAHNLSVEAGGMSSRSDSEGGEPQSTYMTTLTLMRRERFGGPYTVGQTVTGLLT